MNKIIANPSYDPNKREPINQRRSTTEAIAETKAAITRFKAAIQRAMDAAEELEKASEDLQRCDDAKANIS